MTSAPRLAPSSLNWTPATPAASVALAATVIVPATVAPEVGAVMETVGMDVGVIRKARNNPLALMPNPAICPASLIAAPLIHCQLELGGAKYPAKTKAPSRNVKSSSQAPPSQYDRAWPR